jgi:hypothetical protein
VSLNLHNIVRGPIQAVNADTQAILLRSAGSTIDDAGERTPRYLQAQTVMIQVQPMAAGDLRQAEFLNLQGNFCIVFGYGSTNGIVRPTAKGGDLLQFAQYPGDPISTWLTSQPLETWATGWSKVIAVLQTDPAP